MLNIIPDYDLFALGEGVSTVSMKPGKKAAAAPTAGTGKRCKRTKTAGSGARMYRVQPKSTLQLDGGPSGPMLSYSDSLVTLRMCDQTVTLRGKNLRLAAFRGDRITVRGQLLSLELEEARA